MVKKGIALSVVTTTMLFANVDLGVIEVTAKPQSVLIDDISGEELKSADLAEALSKQSANIALVRGSGIANDIILRGQKKDNINILIDGAKIYGACPNRMDPPTSHIETNNIKSVRIIEGPYDVENFGTLSGLIEIDTKKPTKEFDGEINLNAGNFGYKKVGASASGGNDLFAIYLSGSYEESNQYKDGDGNTFSQQLIKQNAPMGNRYKASEANRKAYEKKTFMIQTFFDVADNQELRLGYKRAESDKVLYPSRPMDADYDYSNIYTLDYSAYELGSWSDRLDFSLYKSDVDHPMSTRYRNVSNTAPAGIVTNHLETNMIGAKLKNSFSIDNTSIGLGVDTSKRNWDGKYKASNAASAVNEKISINDTDTKNSAVFMTMQHKYQSAIIDGGLRYDDTKITHGGNFENNSYDSLSANVMLTYKLTDSMQTFIGTGISHRVPDARELYFQGNGAAAANPRVGTPNLKQTRNHEYNVGFTHNYDGGKYSVKGFYSNLKNYIYNIGQTPNTYLNIDAKIYGFDILGSHAIIDNLYFDYGLAYLRGEKKGTIAGQSDKDLAEIPPLRTNVGLTYDFGFATLSGAMQSSGKWSKYDSDNGEQKLKGYNVFNIKYNHIINKNFDLTLGVDNLFDKTYTTTNTYHDVNLVSTGSESFLINEPGRYGYINLRYKF